MDDLLARLLAWFALEEHGLATVFAFGFAASTLLPVGSEPVLATYVKLNPGQFWLAVSVAAFGNTLGGALTYWMGRGAKQVVAPEHQARSLDWLRRLGPKALFFSFLPVVGDPLCAVAGWVRMPFWRAVGWMAAGKFLRYAALTGGLLSLPDQWWRAVLGPLA